MGARFGFWWLKHKKTLEIIGIVLVLLMLIVVIALVILGYIFNWEWTGLKEYGQISTTEPIASKVTKTTTQQPMKTLWDWLQLLIIPFVLATSGYIFNLTVSRNEQKSTQLRDKTEKKIALDNQHENVLQSYIDKMAELLLEKKLRESAEDAEVRKIARVRTLTVLPRLDKVRKKSVLQFLYESGLLNKDKLIVDLKGANLIEANLRFINLSGANLSEANLKSADLFSAHLSGTNLNSANLNSAFLIEANLDNAELNHANLNSAELDSAELSRTHLNHAHLINTVLYNTNLSKAILTNANLTGANLNGANLTDAIGITIEELEKQAKSLQGATMPDGSKHP